MHRLLRRSRGGEFTPPVGKVDFGDLRRRYPFCRVYGYERGRPIDRYYIENFLERNADAIQGRVLEIGDDSYTRRFGGDRVTHRDVLHAHDVPEATIIGDITAMPDVPADHFDCMIVNQTLQLIYDIEAAIAEIYRVLKPGGTLLATFPGLSQISDPEWRHIWHWGFTGLSTERFMASAFPRSHTEITTHGNALAAAAFLFGLAEEDLTPRELDLQDPDYHLLLTVRATKPAQDEALPMEGRWSYGDGNPEPYDAEDSYRLGMEFLDGHGTVEDWGCGTAFARRFLSESPYVGVDGSKSPHADVIADLQTYCSEVDCIFMRHVLEHNYGWRLILANAVASFGRRMVLIVFTPFAASERKIGDNDDIPDLALKKDEILGFFQGLRVREESIESATEYGREHIFYIERP